jgi:acyl carrier protein
MNKTSIQKWVKEELVFNRLRLGDVGISLDEIQHETPLFEDEGLSLDSIDGLELAVGIEQKFGIKIGKMTPEIAHKKFKSVATITDFILESQHAKIED